MALIYTITERGFTAKLAKRKLNDINRNAVYETGEYWHEHFRLKHFTKEGAAEYHYAPRARGYMIYKAKKWGHQNPLVFSGDTRTQSNVQTIHAVASAGNATARVVLHCPTLNLIPKGGHINLRDEMTRVSVAEADKLGQVVGQSLSRQFNALNEPSTTKIG